LQQIMALAADRDLIARQYVNGFREVLQVGLPALVPSGPPEGAILRCQLQLLCELPDTLIARKHGQAEADEGMRRARHVRDLGWPETEVGWSAWHDLDQWLRDPGCQRNPGATADLVAACLFLALRTGTMPLPGPRPWRRTDIPVRPRDG
jgi:triphosphoribosyl-dephospho-CoA synthase